MEMDKLTSNAVIKDRPAPLLIAKYTMHATIFETNKTTSKKKKKLHVLLQKVNTAMFTASLYLF